MVVEITNAMRELTVWRCDPGEPLFWEGEDSQQAWADSTRLIETISVRARGRAVDINKRLRHFACACVRRVWPLLGERFRHAVQVAERFADGKASDTERVAAAVATRDALFAQAGDSPGHACRAAWATLQTDAIEAAFRACQDAAWALAWTSIRSGAVDAQPYASAAREYAIQMELLRDVFPTEPVGMPLGRAWSHDGADSMRIAREIVEEGRFEFLPFLADALVDEDCREEAVLAHCRTAQVHCRGCWALAWVLGKP